MKRTVALWLACLMVILAAAALAVPAKPSGFAWAVDETGTLSQADKDEIAEYGQALLDATGGTRDGDQVVAVITKFLDGEDGADVATDIINSWGLGDNSIVILLATGDRDIQIAAGKGLDRLFSAKARGEILDQNIDYFANNQFADGMVVLYEAVCSRVATLRGKTLSLPSQEVQTTTGVAVPPTTTASGGGSIMSFAVIIVLVIILLMVITSRRRRRRRMPPPPAQNLFGGMGSFGNTRNTRNAPPPPPARPSGRNGGPVHGGGYWGGNTRNATPPAPQRPSGRSVTPPTPQRPSAGRTPGTSPRSSGSLRGLGSLGGLFGGSRSSGSSTRSSSSSGSSRSSSGSSSSGSFSRSGGSRGSSTGRKF